MPQVLSAGQNKGLPPWSVMTREAHISTPKLAFAHWITLDTQLNFFNNYYTSVIAITLPLSSHWCPITAHSDFLEGRG